MVREDPPEDWRKRDTRSDELLSAEEKELLINCPNMEEHCGIYTDIPTFIKWVQSIEESEVKWVRMNDDGDIIGINATMPKGMLTLKSSGKKNNNHSNLVSYGPHYESDSDRKEFSGTQFHDMDDDE